MRDRLLDRLFLRFLPDELRPNHLTVFRLMATPFVALTVWSGRFDLALPLFLVVAFTDVMDGSLARVRGQITEWGTIWDPVADKALVGSVALLLLYRNFPEELAVLIVGIEAIFLLAGYYRKRQGRIVSANRWGKTKMLLQVVGIAAFMLALAASAPWLALASYVILLAAVVFALISLFSHGL